MPHKKAKKSLRDAATKAQYVPLFSFRCPFVESVREQNLINSVVRLCRGYDNAPTASTTGSTGKKGRTGKGIDSFGGRSDLGGMSKNLHRFAPLLSVPLPRFRQVKSDVHFCTGWVTGY
jgi:hypothetical protein